MAIYRYRYTQSGLPIQTFAAVRFSELDNSIAAGQFQIFTSPNPQTLSLSSLNVAQEGWFPIAVTVDSTYFYAVVFGESTIGTYIYKGKLSDMSGVAYSNFLLT